MQYDTANKTLDNISLIKKVIRCFIGRLTVYTDQDLGNQLHKYTEFETSRRTTAHVSATHYIPYKYLFSYNIT